ncbi:DUF6912 family protein [Nocardioides gilvus]|uniref:DUF6912 family protein n=1 Tax=Nocardioides gilvus TaxID=1735589 RepID=UPI000D744169|nr:hypothetical protein [Nocardioides gilvus]
MTVRLYVPATVRGLRTMVDDQRFVSEPGAEPVLAEADDEESEYAALMTAADLSTALAVQADVAGLRRVVVVVESPVSALSEPVPLRDVVAVHLDTEDRARDADPDDDLAWFAPTELAELL